MAQDLKPRICVLAMTLPGLAGSDVLRRIQAGRRSLRSIVVVSGKSREEPALAFKMGARGVVPQDANARVLAQAVRSVMEGRFWAGNEASTHPDKAMRRVSERAAERTPAKRYRLTRREMQVVSAIASGFSNREIARRYAITEDTVKHHTTNIFDKVGVSNRLELALFAIHHGLVGLK
jgi:DNA-binding NarL/FixJ family response regulator